LAVTIFRTHPVPRRDSVREWLVIAATYTIFFGILWAAYEISFWI
jgi:NADPH-dependent 7-cyano-7-deazaguanine reductase QueF-like protein